MKLVTAIDAIVANEGSSRAGWKMLYSVARAVNIQSSVIFTNLAFVSSRIIGNIFSTKETFSLVIIVVMNERGSEKSQ